MEKLETKAGTLKKLFKKLKHAEILPQICFTVRDWYEHNESIIKNFDDQDWNESVAVRSSALMEDTESESFAGVYESVLDVSGKNEFVQAVEKVIASYDGNEENQILVQPMLNRKNLWAGVAFTMSGSL